MTNATYPAMTELLGMTNDKLIEAYLAFCKAKRHACLQSADELLASIQGPGEDTAQTTWLLTFIAAWDALDDEPEGPDAAQRHEAEQTQITEAWEAAHVDQAPDLLPILTELPEGYPEYLSLSEASIIEGIITLSLAKGYEVSVYDSEEYQVKRSRNIKAIRAGIAVTDETALTIRDPNIGKGQIVVSIELIHGNDWDVIGDCSDFPNNPDRQAKLDEIMDPAMELANRGGEVEYDAEKSTHYYEVRGDDGTVLHEGFTQAECKAFIAGYTRQGDWGGHSALIISAATGTDPLEVFEAPSFDNEDTFGDGTPDGWAEVEAGEEVTDAEVEAALTGLLDEIFGASTVKGGA